VRLIIRRYWRGALMDTPQVLLEHYLKQLGLPTMLAVGAK
jgi:hypothetical protein